MSGGINGHIPPGQDDAMLPNIGLVLRPPAWEENEAAYAIAKGSPCVDRITVQMALAISPASAICTVIPEYLYMTYSQCISKDYFPLE